MVTIKLTKKEAETLQNHWLTNLNYGMYGTFGDGENFDDVKEYERAKRINTKIREARKGGEK